MSDSQQLEVSVMRTMIRVMREQGVDMYKSGLIVRLAMEDRKFPLEQQRATTEAFRELWSS